MNSSVSVKGYPRLHFGLIDLAGVSNRSFGGAGVAIQAEPAEVVVRPSRSLDLHADLLSRDGFRAVTRALARASERNFDCRASVEIVRPMAAHVGLGSSTATVLAVLQGLSFANSWDATETELVHLSGRGRTSGVGCKTFFSGGLAVDVGQPGHPEDGVYRPSRDAQERLPSLSLGAWLIPKEWQVALFAHNLQPSVHPDLEIEFFKSNTPVPQGDVLLQLSDLYHGILPAVLGADLPKFSLALQSYQNKGFKAAEISAQNVRVQTALRRAWDAGYAAGLSSLGPILFVVHDTTQDMDLLSRTLMELRLIGRYKFRNTGAEIQ